MSFLRRVVTAPFVKYNELLETHPLPVKCVTSGCLYAGGDLVAQYVENFNENKTKSDDDKTEFVVNYKRIGIFFVYGTAIGGPAYHYWFNYLNELPALLWRMKQTRQRNRIIRSYAFLKSHGIEVKLDMTKLPKALPLSKWKGKAAKIAADQLIFSSLYTLVFFMGIGVMNGAVDRVDTIYGGEVVEAPKEIARTISKELAPKQVVDDLVSQIKEHLGEHPDSETSAELENEQNKIINEIFDKIRRTHELRAKNLTWKEIWTKSWLHTKEVYLETYLYDCIVWPPLQLINFTFIPLRFQFLFVNIANIGWNTFLSLMANKKH